MRAQRRPKVCSSLYNMRPDDPVFPHLAVSKPHITPRGREHQHAEARGALCVSRCVLSGLPRGACHNHSVCA